MFRRQTSVWYTEQRPSPIWGCAVPDTSVLGRDVQEILTRFTTNEKTKFKIADGPGILCGAVVRIDETARKAIHIERIQIRPEQAEC